MEQDLDYKQLKDKLWDRWWRINHLYKIKDANGKVVTLNLNQTQTELFNKIHHKNASPKARKLWVSTYVDIQFADWLFFNSNQTAGIISDTMPNAKSLLSAVKFAIKNMHPALQEANPLVKDDETEIQFANGSRFYATTSTRWGTPQYLHVSEYWPIGKDSRVKEREIKNGALNSVPDNWVLFVESTSIWPEWEFYEICLRARQLQAAWVKLTPLDYALHFFPWWKHPAYKIEPPEWYVFNQANLAYFQKVEAIEKIQLSPARKFWWSKKKENFWDDIYFEFPSTFDECFEVHSEDKYYQSYILDAMKEKRIMEFPIERGIPVHTVWDIWFTDYCSIWFFQIVWPQVRIVDFLEWSGEQVAFYAEEIIKKKYLMGTTWLPHDANNNLFSGKNTFQILKGLWFDCKLVPRLDIAPGIDAVRALFPRIWFRESTTNILTEHLKKYKKKWSDSLGVYIGPEHDEHSHAADMTRYMAVAIKQLFHTSTQSSGGVHRQDHSSLLW